MNKPVADEYNTSFGQVLAVRVTEENADNVALWCNGQVIKYDPLDAPETLIYVKLKTHDRHLRVIEDTANPGEWVVMSPSNGHYAVYADKLFLVMVMVKDKEDPFRPLDEEKHENVAKIIGQLMEYQDFVTNKGGGTEETVSAAELAALQIWYEFR